MNQNLLIAAISFSFLASLLTAWVIGRLPVFSFLKNRPGRFSSLDGLRGYLALFVFFHHYVVTWYWKTGGVWMDPPTDFTKKMGTLPVNLFFMITGFLFVGKIVRSAGDVDWLKLYESRLFRIYPLYLFAFVIVIVISFFQSGFEITGSITDILFELCEWLYFSGGPINGYLYSTVILAVVFWTLKYEWLFYLSLPLISFITNRFKFVGPFVLLGLTAYFYLYPVKFWGMSTKLFVYFTAGGGLFYLNHYRNKIKLELLQYFMRPKFIQSSIASLIVLSLVLSVFFVPNLPSPLVAVATLGIFYFIVFGNSLFGLLSLQPSKLLGEISYSIYLLHGIVLYLVFSVPFGIRLEEQSITTFYILAPFLSVFVVIVTSLTFLFIEKTFVEVGKKNYLSRKFSRKFSKVA